jgi:hypothetical protein
MRAGLVQGFTHEARDPGATMAVDEVRDLRLGQQAAYGRQAGELIHVSCFAVRFSVPSPLG